MTELEICVATYIAYLFGSISSAVIVCRLMGLPDPRSVGSMNPGATNVLRIGNKKAAIITLIGDVLKGVIPVLLAALYGFPPTDLAIIAFAAFLGHLYPIFFQFEGGKGVATAVGVILVLSWPTGLLCILTWMLVVFFTRISSLASLTATVLAPIYIWFFTYRLSYVFIVFLMALFLVYRHRSNIANLIAGTERRIQT